MKFSRSFMHIKHPIYIFIIYIPTPAREREINKVVKMPCHLTFWLTDITYTSSSPTTPHVSSVSLDGNPLSCVNTYFYSAPTCAVYLRLGSVFLFL